MTKVFLSCRDYAASAETIELECELNDRRYINFDNGPHGVATDAGEQYEFELNDDGKIDFGKAHNAEDRIWRTDSHQEEISVGTRIQVRSGGGPWTYEVVSVE